MKSFLAPLAFLALAGTAHAQTPPVEDALLNTASTLLCLSEDSAASEKVGACTIALYFTTVNAERRPLLLERAEAALAMGEIETAETDVQSALQHAPTDPSAWVMMAEIKNAKNDPQQAMSAYSTALSFDPGNVAATVGRAMTLHTLGDTAFCIADIEQVLARNAIPEIADAMRRVRGLCRLDAGDFAGAIADLESAYEEGNAMILVSLSTAYLGHGDVEKAYAAAEKAVAALKDNALAHDALYQAMEADDRIDEALERLDAAADAAPDNVDLANLAAWHAYVAGDIERAVKHLPALADSDVPEYQDTIGHVAMAAGEDEFAMDAFAKAIELGGVRMAEYYRERLSAQGIQVVDALSVSVLPGIAQCIEKDDCRLYEEIFVIGPDLPLLRGGDPWAIR